MGYCLPDSSFLLSYNPETSYRVTLALLGIVFQTKPPDTVTHLSVIKESPSASREHDNCEIIPSICIQGKPIQGGVWGGSDCYFR